MRCNTAIKELRSFILKDSYEWRIHRREYLLKQRRLHRAQRVAFVDWLYEQEDEARREALTEYWMRNVWQYNNRVGVGEYK